MNMSHEDAMESAIHSIQFENSGNHSNSDFSAFSSDFYLDLLALDVVEEVLEDSWDQTTMSTIKTILEVGGT